MSLKNINDPMKIDPTEGNIYLKIHVLTDSELKAGEWFSEYYDPKMNRIYETFGIGELGVNGIFTPQYNVIPLASVSDAQNIHKGYFYNNFISKIMGFEIDKPGVQQEKITKLMKLTV